MSGVRCRSSVWLVVSLACLAISSMCVGCVLHSLYIRDLALTNMPVCLCLFIVAP